MTKNELLIHLGCGKKIIPGWVNVDILPHCDSVVSDDVSTLETFEDNSADEIYACHVLEHFGRHKTHDVLSIWNKKLKPGGILRVSVPNFRAICDWYFISNNINDVLGLLVGGQKDEFDYHKVVFDFHSLANMLRQAGFEDIDYYDWNDLDHSYLDDYSQAYLPHMQKESGMLMSLNVIAKKVKNGN